MDKTTSVVLRRIGPCLCERAEEVDSSKFRYACPHWCLFSSCFLLGQCKEHDLAMINQLLDDPKLTARKYREWKVMNTLLLQDIYHQQPAPQDPEDTPQELKDPSSSDCVEKSLWAEARTAPFLVPVPFYKTLPGHTFCLQGNPKPSSWGILPASWGCDQGEASFDAVGVLASVCCIHRYWSYGVHPSRCIFCAPTGSC